jgi:hypothetical protein
MESFPAGNRDWRNGNNFNKGTLPESQAPINGLEGLSPQPQGNGGRRSPTESPLLDDPLKKGNQDKSKLNDVNQGAGGAQCPGGRPTLRRDVFQLSSQEWDAFVRAVLGAFYSRCILFFVNLRADSL